MSAYGAPQLGHLRRLGEPGPDGGLRRRLRVPAGLPDQRLPAGRRQVRELQQGSGTLRGAGRVPDRRHAVRLSQFGRGGLRQSQFRDGRHSRGALRQRQLEGLPLPARGEQRDDADPRHRHVRGGPHPDPARPEWTGGERCDGLDQRRQPYDERSDPGHRDAGAGLRYERRPYRPVHDEHVVARGATRQRRRLHRIAPGAVDQPRRVQHHSSGPPQLDGWRHQQP